MKIFNAGWLSTKYRFLVQNIQKKGLKRAVYDLSYDFLFKRKFRKLGVVHTENDLNTDFISSLSANRDSHANQPSSFYSLHKAFKRISIPFSNINLLDIGCGSGRVLNYGILLQFNKVTGIDLDFISVQKAVENCKIMQKTGSNTLFEADVADAVKYPIPDGTNCIYLFNPFGEKTMEQVVGNIMAYCQNQLFDVYIIYANPVYKLIYENTKACEKIYACTFKGKTYDLVIYKVKASA